MKRLKRAAAASMAMGTELGRAEFGSLPRLLGRAALTFGLGLLFIWLLSLRLADLDFGALRSAVQDVTGAQWLAAAGLTCAAFAAVGHYDAVLHRHFATKIDGARARRAGICAIAVSQTLGLGVVTGAVLRWRMLPEQSFWMATRITVAVAMSFLAGWAVVTACVLILLPSAPYPQLAAAVLVLALAAFLVALIAPNWGFRWPNGFTIARLIGLCGVDMLAAAAGLYVLLGGADIGFGALLPAFLLAYGAGLISGAPGGIGAFEITLLALLPQAPEAELLAGVVAWRLVYFVIPAVIGAGAAMRGPKPIALNYPNIIHELPQTVRRAETGIHAQGAHDVIAAGNALWLVGRTGHVMVGLFDPICLDAVQGAVDPRAPRQLGLSAARQLGLSELAQTARAEGRVCAVYKAGPAVAGAARRRGWAVLACAREAVIDIDVAGLGAAGFSLATPARAGLRRKLRRAEAAGVSVLCPPISRPQTDAQTLTAPPIPWEALDAIAADWARHHGGERGFSMGRYTREYVAGQRLYIALQNGVPSAFVTFHAPGHMAGHMAGAEWTLDLMRHGRGLADGTMHLLIAAAIADAAAMGAAQVSLAAVPEPAFMAQSGRLPRLLCGFSAADTGLLRFKSSFDPRWEGRYILAPNWPALAVAAAGIARAIAFPAALIAPPPAGTYGAIARFWQQHKAQTKYGFARGMGAWQRGEDR